MVTYQVNRAKPLPKNEKDGLIPMKKVIATSNAPSAIGPYSQAIAAGDFLYVSGLDKDGIDKRMWWPIFESTVTNSQGAFGE